MSDETSNTAHMKLQAHRATWEGFVTFVKWAIIFIAILLILMAVFLL